MDPDIKLGRSLMQLPFKVHRPLKSKEVRFDGVSIYQLPMMYYSNFLNLFV